MRNVLLALTTGLVAGQAFALYRELKLKRIEALERRIDELLDGNVGEGVTIDSPHWTVKKTESR